jgi:hypothetical protein
MNRQLPNLETDLPSPEEVLRDPAASVWLQSCLAQALVRDPVDAANDAEILARLLDRRCREVLSADRINRTSRSS